MRIEEDFRQCCCQFVYKFLYSTRTTECKKKKKKKRIPITLLSQLNIYAMYTYNAMDFYWIECCSLRRTRTKQYEQNSKHKRNIESILFTYSPIKWNTEKWLHQNGNACVVKLYRFEQFRHNANIEISVCVSVFLKYLRITIFI